MRVIDPDEYDAAAASMPHLCPHLQLGDRRPGRRLLVDAAADAARSVAELARDQKGLAALGRLAKDVSEHREKLMGSWISGMEMMGSWWLGQEFSLRLHRLAELRQSAAVARPLAFYARSVDFGV